MHMHMHLQWRVVFAVGVVGVVVVVMGSHFWMMGMAHTHTQSTASLSSSSVTALGATTVLLGAGQGSNIKGYRVTLSPTEPGSALEELWASTPVFLHAIPVVGEYIQLLTVPVGSFDVGVQAVYSDGTVEGAVKSAGVLSVAAPSTDTVSAYTSSLASRMAQLSAMGDVNAILAEVGAGCACVV